MLDTKQKHGFNGQTKGYPKRKLLPELVNEAVVPVPPKNNTAKKLDRPPRGRDRVAKNCINKPPPHKGKEGAAQVQKQDLREDLNKKASKSRSIFRPRDRAPARDSGYQANRASDIPVRGQYRTPQPSDIRHDIARYRGASHPLCFTDEVLVHDFSERFKPVNIKSYDGMTDPAVWIEDFILHIHMARGDDLHAIKYLPLKLKGPARH